MVKIPHDYDNPRDRGQWLNGFADSYRGQHRLSADTVYLAGYEANEQRKDQALLNLFDVRRTSPP